MADDASPTAPAVLAATAVATALVAQHVIGKAARDSLFLSHFAVARLPWAMTAASLLSGGAVVLVARALRRSGPRAVAPAMFAAHAFALVLEWLLAQRFEKAAAVVVYLHTAAFGATLLSAFWSVISESFDPHTAKRAVGRIGAGAALGGVLGGVIAWAASRAASLPTTLLVMAALSGFCAVAMRSVERGPAGARAKPEPESSMTSGLAALRSTPYLRLLALLVVAGALLQALLDYALGAQAVATYGRGAQLLSFFAAFQTVIGIVSFAVQSTANRAALERLGIGGTMSLLPGLVGAVGAVAVAAPSLAVTAIQRGADGVLRASLFRSAYEVLFTPLPPSVKRATKTVIDVSFDRLGQLLGSALTLGLLAAWPTAGLRAVMAATVCVAASELALAYGLHRGYVDTLAARLRSGVFQIDVAAIVDATTRKTLSRTLSNLDRQALLTEIEAHRVAQKQGETGRLLERLAHDEIAAEEMRILSALAPGIVGGLGDLLLDEHLSVRARRRAARLLGGVVSERSAQTLALGLDARVLEVRHASGRALVRMRSQDGHTSVETAKMFARAVRELETQSQDVQSIEHVFDLLSLAAPRDAMQLAYGALQSSDPFLRGVALEYLEVVLPAEVRAAVVPRLSGTRVPPQAPRAGSRPLDDLLKSKAQIEAQLDRLRRARELDTEPPPDAAGPRPGNGT